jgi:hypothetical protein
VRLSAWGDSLEYEVVALRMCTNWDGKTQKFLNKVDYQLHAAAASGVSCRDRDLASVGGVGDADGGLELRGSRSANRWIVPKPVLNRDEPLLSAYALEWVAWRTGYPVISDASRYVDAWHRDQLENPLALLTSLGNDLWLRFDPSGYLLTRHKRFWMLNRFEIPERLVRPLEAKWLGWQWLSLDDYATLAAAISDEQARGFTQAQRAQHYTVPHGV